MLLIKFSNPFSFTAIACALSQLGLSTVSDLHDVLETTASPPLDNFHGMHNFSKLLKVFIIVLDYCRRSYVYNSSICLT